MVHGARRHRGARGHIFPRIGPELGFAIQVADAVSASGFAAVCSCCPAMFPGLPELRLCRPRGGATCAPHCVLLRIYSDRVYSTAACVLWAVRGSAASHLWCFVRGRCGHGSRGAARGVRSEYALLSAGNLPRCDSLQAVLSVSKRRIPAECVYSLGCASSRGGWLIPPAALPLR